MVLHPKVVRTMSRLVDGEVNGAVCSLASYIDVSAFTLAHGSGMRDA